MPQTALHPLNDLSLQCSGQGGLGPVIGVPEEVAQARGADDGLAGPPQHDLQGSVDKDAVAVQIQAKNQPWRVLHQAAVFYFRGSNALMQAGVGDGHRELLRDGLNKGQEFGRISMLGAGIQLQCPHRLALGDQGCAEDGAIAAGEGCFTARGSGALAPHLPPALAPWSPVLALGCPRQAAAAAREMPPQNSPPGHGWRPRPGIHRPP